jgi:hypothetical protein
VTDRPEWERTLDKAERALYLARRTVKDARACQRGGPGALARRVASRKLTNMAAQLIRGWLR